MCEFISWKETDGEVLFLTDKDVFSSHGREMLRNNRDNDVLGHGAIDAFFGESAKGAEQCEDQNFWIKDNYPPEIAQHLKNPQTFLSTWGRVLKKSLRADDAVYIIENSPKRWRDALADILLNAIARGDAYTSYCTLIGVAGLSRKQKDVLIQAIAKDKDTDYSYDTLCEVRGLSKKQEDILVQAIAKDAEYSYKTLCYVKGLSNKQKNILVSAVAKDAEYSTNALNICTWLSKKQKAVLQKAAGKQIENPS